LAALWLSRDRVQKALFTVTKTRNLYQNAVGDVVLLQFDKYGLDAGKRGIVTRVAENAAERRAELEVLINI